MILLTREPEPPALVPDQSDCFNIGDIESRLPLRKHPTRPQIPGLRLQPSARGAFRGTEMTAPVHGSCDEMFAKVRDVFERSFESGEIGAGVAVLIDGEPVIDLWGGWADEERTRPWNRDTIVNVYSVTKGLASVCMNRLIEQGLLELDAPVSKYWPEFAQNGKQDITMRLLISHQAGLPTAPPLPRNLANDWTAVTTALAEAAPEWEPGSQQVYHWVTWGYLNGEVLRRIDGRTMGRYLREDVCDPLGADFLLGVGPEHDARCATLVQGQVVTPLDPDPALSPEERSADTAMWGPNSRNWRAAEIPAANGHATAMGVARVYSARARWRARGRPDPASRYGRPRDRPDRAGYDDGGRRCSAALRHRVHPLQRSAHRRRVRREVRSRGSAARTGSPTETTGSRSATS